MALVRINTLHVPSWGIWREIYGHLHRILLLIRVCETDQEMDRILLGFFLLLGCTAVQGLVCNKCGIHQGCNAERNTTCVASAKYPWCFTVATYVGDVTYSSYGCAYFEPCTSWEPIEDQGRTYIKKCCNTDKCNGFHVVEANRPPSASP